MNDGLRYERKYYCGDACAAILRERFRSLLAPDTHSGGVYEVGNLYLDDQYNSAYTEKLSGVARRKKYRARYYNGDFSFIRMECKQKEGDMIRKISSPVSRFQWEELCAGRLPAFGEDNSPVWFSCSLLHNTRGLRPALRLSYKREAFVYEPGNVRATIDSGLRAAPVNGEADVRAFAPGQNVVELKYDRFLPAVVAALLQGLELRESAVSKYVLAKEALWKVWRHDKA